MKLVVWGCGIKGKRIYDILPEGTIVAYIDSNQEYWGMKYQGIDIISYKEYLDRYSEYGILISTHKSQEIHTILRKTSVMNYWFLNDEPLYMYALDRRSIHEVFCRKYISVESEYMILGSSVYSILLYEYLIAIGKSPVIVFDREDSSKNKFVIDNFNVRYVYMDDIDNQSFIDYSLIICGRDDHIKYEKVIDSRRGHVEYVNNSVKKMYNAKYPELEKFKGVHSGEVCVIVANGPSLEFDDLDKLKENKITSFGVNGIYKSVEYTDWRPDYFVVGDAVCADSWHKEIIAYEANNKFILDGASHFWNRILPENIYKIHCSQDYGVNGIDVSDDITYSVSKGMTVLHACLQIAMYMGFTKIYILGADTTQYGDAKKSHFIEDYHDDKVFDVIATPFLDVERVMVGYDSIKMFAENRNIRIMNATRGGALEVFDRVRFDDLFRI